MLPFQERTRRGQRAGFPSDAREANFIDKVDINIRIKWPKIPRPSCTPKEQLNKRIKWKPKQRKDN